MWTPTWLDYEYDKGTGTLTPGLTGVEQRGGESVIAKYTGILAENFLIAGQYGKNDFDRTERSEGDNCPVARDSRGGQTSDIGCWVNFFQGWHLDERRAGRVDADWYLGDHSLRAGLDAEANVSSENIAYSGNTYYRYFDSPAPTDDYPYVARISRAANDGAWDVNSRAAYLQDSWSIGPNITLNVGLRYEEFENKNARGETFIEITDQWAPRLGVVWDPSGQGRSKLYGSYGLYFLPIPSNANVVFAAGEYNDEAFFQWTGEYDLDGSPTGYTDCGRFELDECGNQGSVGALSLRQPLRRWDGGRSPRGHFHQLRPHVAVGAHRWIRADGGRRLVAGRALRGPSVQRDHRGLCHRSSAVGGKWRRVLQPRRSVLF